jgi:saccharopine dehydrogenase (NADP+, L-glutamate forming)
MKRILILGAGRSATCLIDYLISHSDEKNYKITIADTSIELIESKTDKHPNTFAVELDANSSLQREQLVEQSDLVISMLPPHMHSLVANDCLKHSKHLLSASYIDPSIRALNEEVQNKGLIFLFEMGLDPGIDHMSAMKIFDEISSNGGIVISFKSHCGGLVAPESDDNPWHYKISWNPRNIIQAGMAGACYKEGGQIKNLTYQELFDIDQKVDVPGLGILGWYANRDSLGYIPLYKLNRVQTIIRTTLRYTDFMYGWNLIVKFQFTSQDKWINNQTMNGYEFLCSHLGHFGILEEFESALEVSLDEIKQKSPPKHLAVQLFSHLGLFNKEENITENCHSSFDVILKLAEEKWKLKKEDKDLIVMLHEIEYEDANENRKNISSSLVLTGKDPIRTAMAETVGLPLAIAAGLVLDNKIHQKGVIIPTSEEIYNPVLDELESCGISFHEKRWES